MSDAASKPRKPLRAHLISPAPLAAGLGLLAAGAENAGAAPPNFDVVIAAGNQFQFALDPATKTPGSIPLGSGETVIYPLSPRSAAHGAYEFTTSGEIFYALNPCGAIPAPGATDSLLYATNSANTFAQVTFIAPAVADSYSTLEGVGISFDVESNDNLPDVPNATSVLSLSTYTNPAHGTLTHIANGQFQYAPNPGFVGTDTFTYTLNTGLTCSPPAIASPPLQAPAGTKPPGASTQAVAQATIDPATATVTIQVGGQAASAPATNAVGLGLLASLLAWLGLRRRRET